MKRIFSILLTLTMVIGLMSGMSIVASAFDYETAEITGSGTEADPYIIDKAEKFTAVFGEANADAESYGAGVYYKITKDLTITGHSANKMAFKGVLYADSNVTLDFGTLAKKDWWLGTAPTGLSTNPSAYSPLFPLTNGATIKNITLEGTMPTDTYAYAAGPFAAVAINTTFENCVNDMTVVCTGAGKDKVSGVGGLIGTALGTTTVKNCVNNGVVTGKQNVGGIIGFSQYAAASVVEGATDKVFGGEIINSKNYGNVTGGVGAGGIIGDQENSMTVTNCVNYGNVTSNNTWSRAGGIVGGQRYYTTISNCANYGDITLGNYSNSYAAGGIIGYITFNGNAKVLIQECLNAGNIKSDFATAYAGAFVGMTDNPIQVDDSLNMGTITGGAGQGYVIGKASSKSSLAGITIRQIYDIGAGKLSGAIAKNDSAAALIINNSYTLSDTPDEAYIENAINKASVDTLKSLIATEAYASTIWEQKEGNDYPFPTLINVPYFVAGPDVLSASTAVFTSDSGIPFEIDDASYETYALIASKAPVLEGYTLKEFGVITGDGENITLSNCKRTFTPESDKIIQPSGAFGCLLYSTAETINGFKAGETYYVRPYAIYVGSYGVEHIVYGAVNTIAIGTNN